MIWSSMSTQYEIPYKYEKYVSFALFIIISSLQRVQDDIKICKEQRFFEIFLLKPYKANIKQQKKTKQKKNFKGNL